MRKHLVVARWQEDIGWLQTVPPDWEQMVVTKDVDVPNEGREACSYLWALHELYDQLGDDDLVCCVQADPMPHTYAIPSVLTHEIPRGFHGIGHRHTSDGTGLPYHRDLPVKVLFERWVGTAFPNVVEFTAGACFIVSGDLVRKKQRNTYMDMYGEVACEPLAPWVMERIWRYYLES